MHRRPRNRPKMGLPPLCISLLYKLVFVFVNLHSQMWSNLQTSVMKSSHSRDQANGYKNSMSPLIYFGQLPIPGQSAEEAGVIFYEI